MIIMLIIVGSRREGNSYHLAKKIKEAFDKDRINTEIITPGNQKIHICTGCMDCDKNGVCDFKDDMYNNILKVLENEHLLFISPVRWNGISGDLKIFIDRLNPLYSRKKLKGKKMIAVAIGSKGKEDFSTNSAIDELTSFAEAAEMDVILDKEFNDCLDFTDILKQEAEIDKLISAIKEKIA